MDIVRVRNDVVVDGHLVKAGTVGTITWKSGDSHYVSLGEDDDPDAVVVIIDPDNLVLVTDSVRAALNRVADTFEE